MSHYIDGYVVPVPKQKLDQYRRMAEGAGKVWMEHGALQFWECVADDEAREGDVVPASRPAQGR